MRLSGRSLWWDLQDEEKQRVQKAKKELLMEGRAGAKARKWEPGCSRNRGKHTRLEHHKADAECCSTAKKKATEGVFTHHGLELSPCFLCFLKVSGMAQGKITVGKQQLWEEGSPIVWPVPTGYALRLGSPQQQSEKCVKSRADPQGSVTAND